MRVKRMVRLAVAAVATTVGIGLIQAGPGAVATAAETRSGQRTIDQERDARPTKADYRRLIEGLRVSPDERSRLERTLDRADPAQFRDRSFRSDGFDFLTESAEPGCREGKFHIYRKSGLVQAVNLTAPVYMDLTGAFRIPAVDAFINPAIPAPAYPNGTAPTVRKALAGSKAFWETDLKNLSARPVDSSVLMAGNEARRDAALTAIFDRSLGPYYGGLMAEQIALEPAWNGGDHDLFTVSTTTSNQASTDGSSVMAVGVGALNALEYAGVGKAGVREYIASEVVRTVQVRERLVFDSTSPDDSRRAAMMSDAFAGYFLAHRKGGDLGRKGLVRSARGALVRGDCSFASAQHGGTPAQRKRAFEWGAALAKRGGAKVLGVQRLALMYDLAEEDLL